MRSLVAAILAGGESRRMGTDKARLELGGVTLLERAARTAHSASLPVIVVGRDCPDDWPFPEAAFFSDAVPGRGPLGGLQTALTHTGGPVLALACDLPLLTADALRWLSEQTPSEMGEHGLAVRNSGQWEPLFSVYTSACLSLIAARLAEGRLSLYGLIESGDFGRIDAPDWVAAQLINVNTPDELAALGSSRSQTG